MADFERFRPRRDIQDGLIHALARLTQLGEYRPTGVLTTSPSLWLGRFENPQGEFSIFDLADLVGKSVWRSEADVTDSLLEDIRTWGWPDEWVRTQPSYLPSVSGSPVRPDVVLTDGKQRVVAVVEVKARSGGSGSFQESLSQARSIGAAFYCAVDPSGIVLRELKTGSVTKFDRGRFPSPSFFHLTRPAEDDNGRQMGSEEVFRCRTASELMFDIEDNGVERIAIDHTLPWNVVRNLNTLETAEYLPAVLSDRPPRDFLMTLIAMVSNVPAITRFVMVMPRALSVVAAHAPVRSFLESRHGLAGVVELPAGVLAPTVAIQPTIVALGSFPGRGDNTAAFLRISNPTDIAVSGNSGWLSDFAAGLTGQVVQHTFTAAVSVNKPWSVSAYDPGERAAEEAIKKLAPTRQLGDLCQIFLGFRYARAEATGDAGVAIARARDVGRNVAATSELSRFKVTQPIPERYKILRNDILLQRIGESPNNIVAGAGLEGSVAGDTVFILRPKESPSDSFPISQFLRSPVGQSLLAARLQGVVVPMLSITALRNLPMPIFPQEVWRDLDSLQEAERNLRATADQLEAKRLALFDAKSGQDFHEQLGAIRRVALAASESIVQADSFQFQVRNYYPFPLTYAYRTAGTLPSSAELYSEQLRISDNILAYLGSITLALIDQPDRHSLGMDLNAAWRGGISPGGWREMGQRGGKILAAYKANNLAASLGLLWNRKPFKAALDDLIVSRNAFHHGRGPKTPNEYATATAQTAERLEVVFKALAFLTLHPVRLVTDIDAIRGTRRVKLHTLSLVGDHPGLPRQELEYPEPLKKNDLFVQLTPVWWIPLHPFLVARYCPQCGSREIYYVDKWSGKGKEALLKSFERGHTESDAQLGEALEQTIAATKLNAAGDSK